MEKIDTNDVKTLSTLTNDSNPTNEKELEIMMQKPSDKKEDKKDNESANEKQLEMKMQKSTDTQKDTEDNERELDKISNCDATQIHTMKDKEVSLEETKSPTFIDTEDDSSAPTGKFFQITRQIIPCW